MRTFWINVSSKGILQTFKTSKLPTGTCGYKISVDTPRTAEVQKAPFGSLTNMTITVPSMENTVT